ncbi:MAG: DUF4838 domain-containing protein, partial [Phycisphaerae bacterium]
IARDGSAQCAIVVAAEASAPVQHAAKELAFFLNLITGAHFTIAPHADRRHANILVGPQAARYAEPDWSADGLGHDGLVIKTVGHDLILAGGHPRGTLYAVFSFLEDELGCRWWTSTASTIPHRPTLSAHDLDIRYRPPFAYRESFWFDAFDGDWAVRNKCNGNGFRLDAAHGGKIAYAGFVHTAYQLIPPDKYFQEHPEWFSLIDGKRTHEQGQLCLTNDALRRELVRNLKKQLRAHPDAYITSVSQNDNFGNCQCNRCRGVDEEEASPAGTLLRFVNRVAADIEGEFPDVTVSTLAYQYTRHPPKRTRPRHNVMVRLCSIECSFAKALTDDRNRAFRDDLLGWSNITDRLYVWDYVTNFRHYLLPHANLRVLGPNIRFFRDHHVQGVMEQGAYTSIGTEMAPLRAWVLAKLLWNPSRDDKALIEEFAQGYFKQGARPILEYLAMLHDSTDAAGDYVGFYDRAEQANALSLTLLSNALRLFAEAQQAVSDQPEPATRVRIATMPVIYAFLVRWDSLKQQAAETDTPWPISEDIQAVHKQFIELAALGNVTRLGESRGLDLLQQAVDEIANR